MSPRMPGSGRSSQHLTPRQVILEKKGFLSPSSSPSKSRCGAQRSLDYGAQLQVLKSKLPDESNDHEKDGNVIFDTRKSQICFSDRNHQHETSKKNTFKELSHTNQNKDPIQLSSLLVLYYQVY